MLCRERAISRFRSLGLPGKLFLNVSPESLLEQQHYRGQTLALLEANGLTADQIVIELTEQAPIEDLSLLQSALQQLLELPPLARWALQVSPEREGSVSGTLLALLRRSGGLHDSDDGTAPPTPRSCCASSSATCSPTRAWRRRRWQ